MWILKMAKWAVVEHGIRKLVDEIKKLISRLMEKMWSEEINTVTGKGIRCYAYEIYHLIFVRRIRGILPSTQDFMP